MPTRPSSNSFSSRASISTVPISLRRVNCTEAGRGPWRLLLRPENRCYQVRHQRTGSTHTVYYGTRTERTVADAELQATALCAVLNVLKAKRV